MGDDAARDGPDLVFCRFSGGLELTNADGADVKIPVRKAAALTAYLLAGPQTSVSRERLVGLLWSEAAEDTARAALRQCLRRLQTILKANDLDILDTDRHELRIDRSRVMVDALGLLADAEQGIVSATPPLEDDPSEHLLHGFDDLDPSYTAWLRAFRATWRERLLAALSRIVENGAADPETRLRAADHVHRMDRCHNASAALLIRDQLQKDNLTGALNVYRQHWNKLEDDWGEEPSKEIQDMIVSARQETRADGAAERSGDPTDPPRGAPAFGLALPTLSVRSFQPAGPWPHPDYFVDGFQRELVAALVRFREWVVIEEAAQGSLGGPRFVLDGSYGQTGEQATLTVTLVDQRSGAYLFSEELVIDIAEWWQSLRKIVRRIAVALDTHLTRRKAADILPDPGVDAAIFETWLKVRELISTWRYDTNREAESVLRDIIRKAPAFAPAYASISSVLNTRHLSAPGLERRPEWVEAAHEYALKAVSIDPLNTRNQTALAWAKAMRGAFNSAELHFELALDLNPSSPATLVPCAHGLSFCGRHARALDLVRAGVEIDPGMNHRNWGFIMCVYLFAGRHAEAVEAGDLAGASILDLPGWKAAAQALAGDLEGAAETADSFLQIAQQHWRGKQPATPERVAEWFLAAFPIRRPEDRDVLRRGLELAGLPGR